MIAAKPSKNWPDKYLSRVIGNQASVLSVEVSYQLGAVRADENGGTCKNDSKKTKHRPACMLIHGTPQLRC